MSGKRSGPEPPLDDSGPVKQSVRDAALRVGQVGRSLRDRNSGRGATGLHPPAPQSFPSSFFLGGLSFLGTGGGSAFFGGAGGGSAFLGGTGGGSTLFGGAGGGSSFILGSGAGA